ncbi:unnamed protein product, partial [Staurois parvus]
CPSDTADHRSWQEPKKSARSCDQLCPITADHMGHVHMLQQCHLSKSIRASCQCLMHVPHQCHMPHISAHLSCLSVSSISASQCHLSMPISATYQCCLSVPVSAAY